jgi:hypothetical protein
LFQYSSKRTDVFPGNLAAHDQQHETLSANVAIDSAAHF